MALRPKGDCLRVNEYVAGEEIKIGAAVKLDATGKVVNATAGGAVLGVAIDYASAVDKKVKIADHPDQEYLVKKTASAPSSQTDYFLLYDLAAGTDSDYESGDSLDSASGATTPSTLPLRAIGPSNAVVDAGECVVRINNHPEKAGVAGV